MSLIADLHAPLPAGDVSLAELIILGRIERVGGRSIYGQCWSENQLGRRGLVVFRHYRKSPLVEVEITRSGAEMLTQKRDEWRRKLAARDDPVQETTT